MKDHLFFLLFPALLLTAGTFSSCCPDPQIPINNAAIVEADPSSATPPESQNKEHTARIPMVMINDMIYYDTGLKSDENARCGVLDGSITSTVSSHQTPTENDQSNFGTDYGYQYAGEGVVEICIDGEWYIFEHRSGDGSLVLSDGVWVDQANHPSPTLN